MWARSERLLEKNGVFYSTMLGLFLVSFALPIMFAVRVFGGRISAANDQIDEIFPSFLTVSEAPTFIRIVNTPAINPGDPGNPSKQRDYLLTGWFKVKRLPQVGERVTLFSKFDTSIESWPGFALALNGEADSIRPSIYWKGLDGKGNWFQFSEIAIAPRTWCMLALSFREGRFLGLHSVLRVPGKEPEITLLGGYDLNGDIQADSAADLIAGATSKGKFRGLIGRIGVFQIDGLANSLKSILTEMANKPDMLPGSISPEQVASWYRFEDKSAPPAGIKLELRSKQPSLGALSFGDA